MLTRTLGALLLAAGTFLATTDLAGPVQAIQVADDNSDADTTAPQKGPCVPLTYGAFPTFNCGADNCSGIFGSCDDGSWTAIQYTPGYCRGQEGGCTTFPSVRSRSVRVDCKCQADGTTCAFNQYQFSGSITVTACADVAVAGTGN